MGATRTEPGFLRRLLDLISPRICAICGRRLGPSEEHLCARCNLHLPRTGFAANPLRNEMAKTFWIQLPVERAAALFFYEPHAEVSRIVYRMKYGDEPEIGRYLGGMMAKEFSLHQFFSGMDAIVPVPLTKKRQRERGYNQSLEIARGIGAVAGLPVMGNAVERTSFGGSQTRKDRLQRHENVENAFRLADAGGVKGKHLLLVDDIVTTGATVIACAALLVEAGAARISIASLGFTKT